MKLILSCLSFATIFAMTNMKSRESMNHDKLIVGISTNSLLAGTVESYGVLPATRSAKSNELVVVGADTAEVEQLSIDTKENMKWKWRGRRYPLMRNESQVGVLGIGVFADPNESLRIYRDVYCHTSVMPMETLGGDLGQRSVRWSDEHYKGLRRVLFVRDNVVVDVSLFIDRLVEMGGLASATMEIAGAIDKALVQGTLGVRRGSILRMPRIVAVEVPAKLISRSRAQARVQIAVPGDPSDADSRDVEVVRTLPFYTPSFALKDKAEPENSVTYHVTYITTSCVVVSKEVTVAIQAAAPPGVGDADLD